MGGSRLMGVRRSGWRLGVGAAVITVALAACSGLPWASDSGASPAASAKALEAARASLQRVARGQAVTVVATDAAFEAATYDQHGHLDFWADTSGSWTRQAARSIRARPGGVSLCRVRCCRGCLMRRSSLTAQSSSKTALSALWSMRTAGQGGAFSHVKARPSCPPGARQRRRRPSSSGRGCFPAACGPRLSPAP